MDFHSSFALWTPEIYLRAGSIHFYASIWKLLMFVGVLVVFRFLSRVDRISEPVKHSHLRAEFLAALFMYGLSILWPFGIEGAVWPWNSPPDNVVYEGIGYGSGYGGPDPRVDTYGCNPEQAIRDGTFVAGKPEAIRDVRQVGTMVGIFGGPSLYVADDGSAWPWLVVRPTADCWIPYPVGY